jgi:DNA-binding GntR family transcriptional regulator
MSEATAPMSLTPQTRDGNASIRVADALREAILSGEYAPGSRLRQEEIAERLGASRVPVREALKALEADGLITVVANAGAWVSRLTLDECDEVYQTRERVEPLLLRFAAPGIAEPLLDRLESIARAMTETDDVEEFLRLDRTFHLSMYEPATTFVLHDLVHRLWNTTQPYRRAYTLLMDTHSQRIVHDEHHMLITSLREHDVDSAERVLHGHIRRTRLRLAAHPEIFANDNTPIRQKGPSWPSQ